MEVFIIATENSALLRELLKSVKYMVDTSINEAPYDRTVVGLVVGGASKKKYYNVTIQGKTYELPSYINNTIKPNTTVNVMIPQNNMDFAFIYSIFGGEEKGTGGGGSGGHADTADYATTAGYANTVAVATETVVGGLLSSTGKNHVTVSPTGIATVTDVSHADNADNATNAVNATNALNATHANKADSADVADTVKNVPIATDTKVGGIKSGTGIGVVNVADDGTATVELPPEPDPYILPIATDTVLGGIYSSTGPGHVVVNPDGTAVVPDAGGIKEIPIATEEEIGGVLSSSESGKLNVDSDTGVSTINDVVLIDESGKFTKPEEWGKGPWELVCTEDNSLDVNNGLPRGGLEGQYLKKSSDEDFDVEWGTVDLTAENITYSNSVSGMSSQNVQKAIDELNTRDNSISQQVSANIQSIENINGVTEELGKSIKDNSQEIEKNATDISTNSAGISKNTQDISNLTTSVSNNTSSISVIRNRIEYYSNPNLLDNWYFANPINQKGQTQYPTTPSTINSYYIDRWIDRETITCSLQDGFIRFFRNTQQYSPVFAQIIDNVAQYRGKTLIGTILYRTSSDFTGYLNMGFSHWSATETDVNHVQRIPLSTSWNINSYIWTVPDNVTRFDFRANQFTASVPVGNLNSNYIDLIAAKLELGTQQTLAHQDSSGNWVLNDPPPNYSEEYNKCTYYYLIKRNFIWNGYTTTDGKGMFFETELPKMRVLPAIQTLDMIYINCNGVRNASPNSLIATRNIEGGNPSAYLSMTLTTTLDRNALVNGYFRTIELDANL